MPAQIQTIVIVCLTLSVSFYVFSDEIEDLEDLEAFENFEESNEKEFGSPQFAFPGCQGLSCGNFIANFQNLKRAKSVIHNKFDGSNSDNESCEENADDDLKPAMKTKVFDVEFDMSKFGFDLYYMMDGTGSFDPDRELLSKRAPQFAQSLQKLSKGSRFGFGLFGDKYIWNRHSWGFKNLMSLTNDTSNFAKVLKGIKNYYGGSDYEEDPLTGIHQAAVCKSRLNWRDDVLRMLLVTTDEDYQRQNLSSNRTVFDGKCHMDASGTFGGSVYTWQQDYPTLDDIKKALKDYTIQIVFAIAKSKERRTSAIKQSYRELAENLDAPMPIVLTLQHDSENVMQVIRDAYDQANNPVKIETTLTGPNSTINEIVVNATCAEIPRLRKFDSVVTRNYTNICDVPKNKIVEFRISVTMPCPLDISDVTLTTNLHGRSTFKPIDLTTICTDGSA